MSKISSDDVKKVAKLANFPFVKEEIELFSQQLAKVLDYIDQLNSANTSNVEPTFNVTGLKDVLREDEGKESLSQSDALKNTPSSSNGLFKTKGVFDNE